MAWILFQMTLWGEYRICGKRGQGEKGPELHQLIVIFLKGGHDEESLGDRLFPGENRKPVPLSWIPAFSGMTPNS
jgi:hypothetical protein